MDKMSELCIDYYQRNNNNNNNNNDNNDNDNLFFNKVLNVAAVLFKQQFLTQHSITHVFLSAWVKFL